MSLERENALNVALNKVTDEQEFEALADLTKDLKAQNFDVTLTGSDAAEIENLINQVHDNDAADDDLDVNKALEEAAFVKQEDLQLFGRHRLLCWDATKPKDVEKFMDGKKANLVLTDAPYNVDFESTCGLKIHNDKQDNDTFDSLLFAALKNMAKHTSLGGFICVLHVDTEGLNFRMAFIEAEFHLSPVFLGRTLRSLVEVYTAGFMNRFFLDGSEAGNTNGLQESL